MASFIDTGRATLTRFPEALGFIGLQRRFDELFETLPTLTESQTQNTGCTTCNNFRFLRFWWEAGLTTLNFACPTHSRQCCCQDEVVPIHERRRIPEMVRQPGICCQLARDGVEMIKADIVQRYPYLRAAVDGGHESQFYFRRGVTWSRSHIRTIQRSSVTWRLYFRRRRALRRFPEDIPLVLAVLNSSFAQYALNCSIRQ